MESSHLSLGSSNPSGTEAVFFGSGGHFFLEGLGPPPEEVRMHLGVSRPRPIQVIGRHFGSLMRNEIAVFAIELTNIV